MYLLRLKLAQKRKMKIRLKKNISINLIRADDSNIPEKYSNEMDEDQKE